MTEDVAVQRPERQAHGSVAAARSDRGDKATCSARMCWLFLAIAAPVILMPRAARSDRREVQWSARPLAGIAELQEEGASMQRTLVGGMSLGLSYGISNRFDIGAELVALATMPTTFMDMAIIDGGAPYRGPLVRSTDSALFLFGPTWRLGVSWVPVISLEAGGGARYRSAGTFTETNITLDEKRAGVALDLAVCGRVGVEHRVNRRLTVGVYASALASWGPSAPLLPVGSVSFGISYVNYPLW